MEFLAGIIVYFDMETENGACVIAAVEAFQRSINLEEYRLHTKTQLLI